MPASPACYMPYICYPLYTCYIPLAVYFLHVLNLLSLLRLSHSLRLTITLKTYWFSTKYSTLIAQKHATTSDIFPLGRKTNTIRDSELRISSIGMKSRQNVFDLIWMVEFCSNLLDVIKIWYLNAQTYNILNIINK